MARSARLKPLSQVWHELVLYDNITTRQTSDTQIVDKSQRIFVRRGGIRTNYNYIKTRNVRYT